MNWPARPVGIGPIGMKFKNPLSPNTKKISPSKRRAINAAILIYIPPTSFLSILGYLTHLAVLVIFNRLKDFFPCVHHEWTIASDRFVQWYTANQQHLERRSRVS